MAGRMSAIKKLSLSPTPTFAAPEKPHSRQTDGECALAVEVDAACVCAGSAVKNKPLAIDLFCGLFGWSEGLVAAGYEVIGFDLEDMHAVVGKKRPEHLRLVLQDVLTLHGSQFRDAALIVASPPCQDFSYMAMPWSLAKAKAAAIRADKTGQMQADLTRLFDACFRIQREACEAAGRHIPMVVENVRGAQPWVGRAAWNMGAFYLWGDVPALMPVAVDMSGRKLGLKQGGTWWHDEGSISRTTGSKSPARKAASAMIAKIPFALSRHIAEVYRP